MLEKNLRLLEAYRRSLPDSARSSYGRNAEVFLDWAGNRPLNADTVRTWIEKRRRAGYADGTLRHEFGVIHRLFEVNSLEWSFRRGDAPLIREHEEFAPALAIEDVQVMVDVVLGRVQPQGPTKPTATHRAFLALSTVWALRRGEMIEVNPESLNAKQKLIFVKTLKEGRQRWHVVPDYMWPHLEGYGFSTPASRSALTILFDELKIMVGFTRETGLYIGWHSIRRSFEKAAFEAGFSIADIHSFCRYKRPTSNMPLRYGTARTVSHTGVIEQIATDDAKLDARFYEAHPFPQMWR